MSLRTSLEFPEGYGDFKLISSDGVVFHFPKFLLSYQSPVFEGMFAAGSAGAVSSDGLQLTEDSNTLECFLRYLDPKKKFVPPEINLVEPLLEASRKYDVPRITERWEEQMMTRWKGVLAETEETSRPMECLAIASRFNLDSLARVVLRELIKAPITDLKSDMTFESRMFTHLILLRANRISWFDNKVASYLNATPLVNCSSSSYHQEMHRTLMVVIREFHLEPSWKTINRHLNDWTCPCGHFKGSQELFNSWKGEIEGLEAEIPELPSRG
ncbi:hypothetical protein FRC20_008420 [Serendipita sp. 405]|nr:hypothetical protein FRC15_008257 [Serendipita sp. 397]KAG8830480.1 hypothetical protein FRC20_008420 [Serendipita sp. 405]